LEEVQGFDIIKKSSKAVCHDPALEAVVVINPSFFTSVLVTMWNQQLRKLGF